MVDRATMWGFLFAPCGYMYSIAWMSFDFCHSYISKVALLEWLGRSSVSLFPFHPLTSTCSTASKVSTYHWVIFVTSSIFYYRLDYTFPSAGYTDTYEPAKELPLPTHLVCFRSPLGNAPNFMPVLLWTVEPHSAK